MTKQHFIALANEIKNITDNAARKAAAEAVARAAAQFNGKFDRQRFLAACNVK